jgi:hypothetical protein
MTPGVGQPDNSMLPVDVSIVPVKVHDPSVD